MRETLQVVYIFSAQFQCSSLSDTNDLQPWSCYSVFKDTEITLTSMWESFWLATLPAPTNDALISRTDWASWCLHQASVTQPCFTSSLSLGKLTDNTIFFLYATINFLCNEQKYLSISLFNWQVYQKSNKSLHSIFRKKFGWNIKRNV